MVAVSLSGKGGMAFGSPSYFSSSSSGEEVGDPEESFPIAD